jgi:hypothetical protein
MTTNPTTRPTTSPNRGSHDNVGEAANGPDTAARLPAKKSRPWSFKILGVLALLAAATVFAPSCAVSGSDTRMTAADSGDIKRLSPETVEALRKDTGVDPVYVLVVPAKGPQVVGVPSNLRATTFDKEQDLWENQGKVSIRSVKPAALVQFQRNPEVYCISYTLFGSLRWYCVELPS